MLFWPKMSFCQGAEGSVNYSISVALKITILFSMIFFLSQNIEMYIFRYTDYTKKM